MSKYNPVLFVFLFTLVLQSVCFSQSSGIISGRVTIGDKGAANVTVMLISATDERIKRKTVATTTTNGEGFYRISGVAEGKYQIATYSPTFFSKERDLDNLTSEKTITIREGETVENIDFKLKRGGVITGRVTDSEGYPVIAQRVFLESVDGKLQFGGIISSEMFETDDRGIYRIYGLPEGRYLVSLGEGNNTMQFGMKPRTFFMRTFHPSTTEKSEAKIIELGEGEEETNVDITLGQREKTFSFSGRVIDAEARNPVTNLNIAYGKVSDDGKRIGGFGYDTYSDNKGQFVVEGVKPGRYATFVVFDDKNDYRMSDAVPFEITDSNLNGIDIKVRKGASISGVAVLEGIYDQTVLAKLAEIAVTVSNGNDASTLSAPNYRHVKIGANGNFRFNGLSSGKYIINTSYPQPKNFVLVRVEQNGVEFQNRTIELAQGADVSNVRLVFEYGANILRGQINIVGGELPQGTRLIVGARKIGHPYTIVKNAEVDGRSQFVIEGLSAGEYDVSAMITGLPKPKSVRQRVVINNSETNMTITLDLNNQN